MELLLIYVSTGLAVLYAGYILLGTLFSGRKRCDACGACRSIDIGDLRPKVAARHFESEAPKTASNPTICKELKDRRQS